VVVRVLKIATALGSAPAVALLGPIKLLNPIGLKILLARKLAVESDAKLMLEFADLVLVDTRSE
jgi:hypothetical protein